MNTVFNPCSQTWFSRRYLAALTVVVIFAAILRFYGLARESLWLDEICSWHTATHSTVLETMYEDVDWHLHPPGYFLFLRCWIALFGDAEWSLRAPSAIAGLLSVPLIYVLGCRCYGPREGLVASALTGFLLFPVWYSQDARPYAILLAQTIGTTIVWTALFERVWRKARLPWHELIAYVVLAIATCYTHYFGLMFIALQAGALGLAAVRDWRSVARVVFIYGLTLVAYIPWWSSFWLQLTAEGMGHPTPTAGFASTFARWLGEYFNYRSPHHAWIVWLGIGYAIVLVALCVRTGLAMRKLEPASRRVVLVRAALAAGWLSVPFLFAYGKSVTSASIYTQRNLIVTAPIVYLLAARALALLPSQWYLRGVVISLLCVSALVRTAFVSGYYQQQFNDDFRSAAHLMVQESGMAANTGFAGTGYNASALNYYFKRMGTDRRIEFWGGNDDDIARFDRWIEQRNPRRLLYVIAAPGPETAFAQHLLDTMTPIRVTEFKNVKVLVLEHL